VDVPSQGRGRAHDGEMRGRSHRAEPVGVRDDDPRPAADEHEAGRRLADPDGRGQGTGRAGAQQAGGEAEQVIALPGGHPHLAAVRRRDNPHRSRAGYELAVWAACPEQPGSPIIAVTAQHTSAVRLRMTSG
jgi:hypothetical protein